MYEKKQLHKSPILTKVVNVTENTDKVVIELTKEDTKICEMSNKLAEFWYEIELNDDTTVIGFDENGAKLLTIYPEGAE